MSEKIKRLEVDNDLKKMALKFLDDIENNQDDFVFPVIGDFIVDRYKFCKVERKNLEHDSLILDLVDSSCYYGGASNVANILGTFSKCSMNKKVNFYLGCGKEDPIYLQRVNLFNPSTFELSIYCDQQYGRVIPIKTRLIGINRNEYLSRIDNEPTRSAFPKLSDDIALHIGQDINKLYSNVIFISDYNKGFISPELLDTVYSGEVGDIKAFCNIRPKRIKHYIGRMHALSFNKTEFIQTYDILFEENLDIISLDNVKRLKDTLQVDNILITFGGNGFIYCGEHDCCVKVDPFRNLSTNSKNIIGAGDMVSAAFAFFSSMNFHFFLAKHDIRVILHLVNCSAFLKVYTGEYTVNFDLLKSYLNGNLCLF